MTDGTPVYMQQDDAMHIYIVYLPSPSQRQHASYNITELSNTLENSTCRLYRPTEQTTSQLFSRVLQIEATPCELRFFALLDSDI